MLKLSITAKTANFTAAILALAYAELDEGHQEQNF